MLQPCSNMKRNHTISNFPSLLFSDKLASDHAWLNSNDSFVSSTQAQWKPKDSFNAPAHCVLICLSKQYIRPLKIHCPFCIKEKIHFVCRNAENKTQIKKKNTVCFSVCFCLSHSKSYAHGDTKQTIDFKRPNVKPHNKLFLVLTFKLQAGNLLYLID